MQVKFRTHRTQKALKRIIRQQFGGSQLEFSLRCGLDTSDTSRVVTGTRSATVELMSRALATLGGSAGAELLSAFLSDVLQSLRARYIVFATPLPLAPERARNKPRARRTPLATNGSGRGTRDRACGDSVRRTRELARTDRSASA